MMKRKRIILAASAIVSVTGLEPAAVSLAAF